MSPNIAQPLKTPVGLSNLCPSSPPSPLIFKVYTHGGTYGGGGTDILRGTDIWEDEQIGGWGGDICGMDGRGTCTPLPISPSLISLPLPLLSSSPSLLFLTPSFPRLLPPPSSLLYRPPPYIPSESWMEGGNIFIVHFLFVTKTTHFKHKWSNAHFPVNKKRVH